MVNDDFRVIKCQFCGRIIEGLPFKCRYCGGVFCVRHRLPESHSCPGIRLAKAPRPGIIGATRERPEEEFTEVLKSIKVRPPIEGKVGEEVVIPKLLFPYNEEWLKLALYERLEDLGVKAFLEPSMLTESRKLRYYDYGAFLLPEWRRKRVRKLPDIVLGEPYFAVWEVENFWKGPHELVKHAEEYHEILGIRAYTVSWLRADLQVDEMIVLVNPLTGELTAPECFYRTGSPPEWRPLREAEIPAGSLHMWMQYELFRWLISQNCLVAVEPRVSGETGQVFAPDEIVLSHEEGIVSWSPRDFTPYKGWTWYSRPHIPGTPIRFDAVSAKLDDPKEVEIFEIKTEKDFRTEKKVWKVLEQLAKYVSMNLARRFWLVVPDEDRLVSALEEFFEKFSEELFAGSKVGLLAYSLPKRTFRVVTEPKLVQKIKTEDMHVRVM